MKIKTEVFYGLSKLVVTCIGITYVRAYIGFKVLRYVKKAKCSRWGTQLYNVRMFGVCTNLSFAPGWKLIYAIIYPFKGETLNNYTNLEIHCVMRSFNKYILERCT